MKLPVKIVSIFFLGILAVSAIFAWIAIRWEEQNFYAQASQRAERLAARIGTDRVGATVPTITEVLS